MKEVRLFLHAIQFLTVIPVPNATQIEPDWLTRSAKYFPLVGILVGAISGGVLLLSSHIWPGVLAVLLAVSASIIVTGALHEDGLADTADGLGGRSRESRLALMKDSRLGTYGALALGICVAFKIAALSALPAQTAATALIAAHGAGRLGAVGLMMLLPYGGDRSAGKIDYPSDRLGAGEFALATVFATVALIPAALIAPYATIVGATMGAFAALALARAAKSLLGGYTGDVLGAAEQLFGTAFLLGIATAASARLTF